MRWLIQIVAWALAPTARRFQRALANPEVAQRRVLAKIGDRLQRSDYGRSIGFRSLDDWERVPIVDYDIIQDWLSPRTTHHPWLMHWLTPHRVQIGTTPEPILFYEQTSGSRASAKHIPYTRSLLHSFNTMFCVWAHDLICHGPKFSTGKIYFSISPKLSDPAANQPKKGGNPPGKEKTDVQDDSDYLDGWLRGVMRLFWVQPRAIHCRHDAKPFDAEHFKEQVCLALLQEERLEIISIWSPSFLTLHLDYIQAHRLRLRAELHGRISQARFHLLGASTLFWPKIWPHLKLISCWDSVSAADSANRLRALFPQTWVQGKGLLATEAPLTVPLIAAQGCVPLVDQVLFEFEDALGAIHWLHELQPGQDYQVIVSQTGGLYRYRLGDRIRVTHLYQNTPCLEFMGRTQSTSDLVGEKLHEDFVADVLKALPLDQSGFKSLIPTMVPTPGYLLLLDQSSISSEAIAQQLDYALCQSYQYRHARKLGQLNPAKVLISSQIPAILVRYQLQCGKTWGGLKHPLLATQPLPTALQAALEQVCLDEPLAI